MGTFEFMGTLYILFAIVMLSVIGGLCAQVNSNRYKKIAEELQGQVAFLTEENRRLREKLYNEYDPQKLRQDWQEDEPKPTAPTQRQGRFSGRNYG